MRNLKLPFLLLCITSCATYNNHTISHNNKILKSKDLKLLEGFYKTNPVYEYGYHGFIRADTVTQDPLLPNYLRLPSVPPKNKDSLNQSLVQIKVMDQESIKCILWEGKQKIEEAIIEGKVKKNGMFHFKNNSYDIQGIPLLAGTMKDNRTRIGIDAYGNLLVQHAYSHYGAFLIVFGDGEGGNDTYSFEKINSNKSAK